MIYKDSVYDPTKQYLGGTGHWLTPYLRDYMEVRLSSFLVTDFDRCAFYHDVDYTGTRRTGFCGWLLDRWDQRRADVRFYERMNKAVDMAFDNEIISHNESIDGYDFAHLAYTGVRVGGWGNFKTNKKEQDNG